ncbi:SLBB domain-containing protein, partial [Vibrio parahaemolyticus]
NPADILAAKVEDMPLSKEDSITIISKDSLKDPATVTISGSVRMAGTYVFRKGMKLEDLIAMAGGFTLTAANHHVEI